MSSSSSSTPIKPTIPENQEFLEVKSVSLEWKLSNLKHIFDTSKGETKSKCVKSVFFGDGKWQVFFYPNSGHDQYCSLYLSCQPTHEEIEKGTTQNPSPITSINNVQQKAVDPAQVPWHREGLFKFTFEIKSLDRRTTYKTMEANDHAFSHEARNWGWAQYWRRNDAYYSNPSAKYNDAFLVCCTIVYSPSPPAQVPTAQAQKRSIPVDLHLAYSSLFNDPIYSDVCFHIIRPSKPKEQPIRKLYASKKILIRRSEYFSTMFESGFAESSNKLSNDLERSIDEKERDTEQDELMEEDSDDETSGSDEDVEEDEDINTSSVAFDEEDVEEADRSSVTLDSNETHSVVVPPIDPSENQASLTKSVLTSSSLTKVKKASENRRPPRTVIEVTDAAFTTFKALLFFLYTDSITFAPLTSTYHSLRDAAEANGQVFEYPSRKEFVKASVISSNINGLIGQREVICSAKAIYRLADKLNLVDLKSRAYEHITRSLTVQNIPMEVFSAFTTAYEEIKKVEVDYMLLHWNELRDSDSLKKVLKLMPSYSEIWSNLLCHLEFNNKKSLNDKNNGFGSGNGGVGGSNEVCGSAVADIEGSGSGSGGNRSIDAA